MNYLLIGLGGALGAICRYYLGVFITKRTNHVYPIGTFIINITGSLLLGIILNLYKDDYIHDWVMFLVGVGFCGAYTTFSTFGNEVIQLVVANQKKLAFIYVGTSVFCSFIAAWIGLII